MKETDGHDFKPTRYGDEIHYASLCSKCTPRVTITKYFPEMEGRDFEEIKELIEHDPWGMLQEADIEIETEEKSTSYVSEGHRRRRKSKATLGSEGS